MAYKHYYKKRIKDLNKEGWFCFLSKFFNKKSFTVIISFKKGKNNNCIKARIEFFKYVDDSSYTLKRNDIKIWNLLRKISKKLNIPCYFVVYFKNKGKISVKIEGPPLKNIKL